MNMHEGCLYTRCDLTRQEYHALHRDDSTWLSRL